MNTAVVLVTQIDRRGKRIEAPKLLDFRRVFMFTNDSGDDCLRLILIGVCCSGGADGTNPYAEVSLQPLPEYIVPSDGITVTCITCTAKGRIFLTGRDDHIYELHYTIGSDWQTRCRKVCLTAGIGSIISRWVVPNVFKFGAVDPIIEMVYDNERHILYLRIEEMKLQVFILGQNADGPLKKVAEEKNLINNMVLSDYCETIKDNNN